MKVAYFGIDALVACLEYLLKKGHSVVEIFTTEGDSYDKTEKITALAEAKGIPLRKTRVKEEDIARLEAEGVELTVTAGYPWKIPVTSAYMQVNLHPSYLPEGRGAWPMPVAILRGKNSGITLHKLSDKFDEGDILLQTEIPTEKGETLISLTEKIRREAIKLLEKFLEAPLKFWAGAEPQSEGEYWEEPGDSERTIFPSDDEETVSRKLRAFAGYGCLYSRSGILWEADFRDGKPVPTRPYFREIKLSDREAMEKIRLKYNPALSDYTFALLWCWRKKMKLSVCLGEDFFLIKGDGYYFFPVASPENAAAFLTEFGKREKLTLRFCGEKEKALISEIFPDAEIEYSEEDCDYLLENEKFCRLSGGKFLRRRNDLHHYQALLPPPEVEAITRENLFEVARLSERCRLLKSADGEAEAEAVKNFFELGMEGVLVKRGKEAVAFAICSEKDEKTAQGHFSKCVERERGGALYAIKSCSDAVADRYEFTNIEDDLGDEGLRRFKRSLSPLIVSSYTVKLGQT